MFVGSLNDYVELSDIEKLMPAHILYIEACYANGGFITSGLAAL